MAIHIVGHHSSVGRRIKLHSRASFRAYIKYSLPRYEVLRRHARTAAGKGAGGVPSYADAVDVKHDLSRSLPRVFIHIGESPVGIFFAPKRLDMMHMQCTLVSSQEPGARSTIYTCLPFVIKDPDLCWPKYNPLQCKGSYASTVLYPQIFSRLVLLCFCCRWCLTPHRSVCLQLEKRSVRYGRGKKE